MNPVTILARIAEHFAAAWYWLRAHVGGATVDASQITQQIWAAGTIETKADVAALQALGITGDIDCQEEHNDAPLLLDTKINYLWNPQTDDGLPKPTEWFKASWLFAQPILANQGVIICHCAAGHNRGPSMAYFLLRASTGMTAPEALALVKAKRPVATLAYAPDADRAIVALALEVAA